MHSGQNLCVLTLQNADSPSAPQNAGMALGTPKRRWQRHVQCPYPLYICQQEKPQRILSQLRTLLLFLGTRFPGQDEFLVICC